MDSFRFAGMSSLADGFEGSILGSLLLLNISNCAIGESQLEAIITVEGRKPYLDGPLTIDGVSCEESASEVETASFDLKLADRNLAGSSVTVGLNANALSQDGFKLSGVDGEIELERRDGLVIAKFNLGGSSRSGICSDPGQGGS
ncbi:MAG TPA: hypothetical protein DCS24_10290 [Erythrobacter sp.]|nr:hypothetical protein [Erythrobacter sp.]